MLKLYEQISHRDHVKNEIFETLMEEAYIESKILLIKLVFHVRDPRGGKGLRKIGRDMMKWYQKNHGQEFAYNLYLVPEYGRWDDILLLLIYIFSKESIEYESIKESQDYILKMLTKQLYTDLLFAEKREKCTQAWKWMPRQHSKWDKVTLIYKDKEMKIISFLCQILTDTLNKDQIDHIITIYGHNKGYSGHEEVNNISLSMYRKMCTYVCKHLNVTEIKMCAKKWDEIDYKLVPYKCMSLNQNAIKNHNPTHFKYLKDIVYEKSYTTPTENMNMLNILNSKRYESITLPSVCLNKPLILL